VEFYENDEELGKIPSYANIRFTRVRQVGKSRISTTCEFCGQTIHKGEKCEYWSGVDLGQFFYYRVCNNCLGCGQVG
jgi:hypothetical protein